MPDAENPIPRPAAQEPDSPRGPWSFLWTACRGGFSRWGVHLLAAWLVFSVATQGFWALHLRRLTGWSSLPSYWGETLTARDLWELLENGGLRGHWTGPWVIPAGGLALAWVLWAGWVLQAETAGRSARFGAWAWGFLDTLAVGLAPLALLAGGVLWGLARLGASGIPALGWLDWAGSSLVRLGFASALFVHWWLFRLARAAGPGGFRLGSWRRLGAHLALGLVRFWARPGQWLALVLASAALRSGLTLAVLGLGWRLGGGSVYRVVAILLLEVAAVLANAWLLGWFLRLTALFLRHDETVRTAVPASPAPVVDDLPMTTS